MAQLLLDRASELRELREALVASSDGTGSVIMVEGPAGIATLRAAPAPATPAQAESRHSAGPCGGKDVREGVSERHCCLRRRAGPDVPAWPAARSATNVKHARDRHTIVPNPAYIVDKGSKERGGLATDRPTVDLATTADMERTLAPADRVRGRD
jgi:hypothetical protein